MSENLPAVVKTSGVGFQRPDLLNSLAEIERVALACAKSGYYKDVRDASQAVVKMLAGREMGVGPIQALASIYIVEGKPTAGANLIASNVKRSGRYDYRIQERTDERCEIAWFQDGKSVGTSAFSMADAKRADLAGKMNWKKYPRAMLFARALTEGVRVYAPDAAAGAIYTPEELNPDLEVSESGEVINGQIVEPTPKAPSVSPGVRVKECMELRCEELGVDPKDYAMGALKSILRALEIPNRNNAKAIADREDDIRAAISAWKPPTEEDGKEFAEGPAESEGRDKRADAAEPGTFGADGKATRRIHAFAKELGYEGSEAHRMIHNALPAGTKSLSDLPLSAEGDLRARLREISESAAIPQQQEAVF